MKPVLVLVALLCFSASTYAQAERVDARVEFPDHEITIDRSHPDNSRPDADHSGAHDSRGNQQPQSKNKTPLQAAREEMEDLQALINDPVNGPILANNPDLQKEYLNKLRDATAYFRELEAKERRDAAAREAWARDAAAKEAAARQAEANRSQRTDRPDHH